MPAYRIHNKNVLFIHVPKTGGTTVESFLETHGKMSLHNQGVKLLKPVFELVSDPLAAAAAFSR